MGGRGFHLSDEGVRFLGDRSAAQTKAVASPLNQIPDIPPDCRPNDNAVAAALAEAHEM